jgi:hypothetical protein
METQTLTPVIVIARLPVKGGVRLSVEGRAWLTKDDVKTSARDAARVHGHRLGLFARDGETWSAECLACGATVTANRKPEGDAPHITGTAITGRALCKGEKARRAKAAQVAAVKAERDAEKAVKAKAAAKAAKAAAKAPAKPARKAAKAAPAKARKAKAAKAKVTPVDNAAGL